MSDPRISVSRSAEKETNGCIKCILASGSVNSLTRLILANALYFKGDWKDRFDALGTKEYDFHLLNGNSVKAPFMTYRVDNKWKACFSMYVFLPNERDGLPALVERFSSECGFLDRHLPRKTVEVGLELPFVPGGLTEMGDGLYVSSIQHGSFIDVNDDGTEAAAVTVALLLLGSSGSQVRSRG
ncbi:putative Serpin family protein [Rosa chinensis]|uniref:Putative Serpin family protein n=1 Tax=Rosa chinensis TaxID=74649 RepID=A0A2P6P9W5_ROSCH|nr:putative Serpin family protein [Rosa chinensis]